MIMVEITKFKFDTEFRPEGDLVSNAARARQRKVMTQEELDHMLSRARETGLKMGQVRAAEATAAAASDGAAGTARRRADRVDLILADRSSLL